MEGREVCNLHRKRCRLPRAALQALSPICQVNREDAKEPEKVRRKEPGSLSHRWEQRALQACDQEHPHWSVAGPRAERPLRSAAGILGCPSHSRARLRLPYPCAPGPRLKKHSRHFFRRLQSPFLPAYTPSLHCALVQRGFSATNKTKIGAPLSLPTTRWPTVNSDSVMKLGAVLAGTRWLSQMKAAEES